MNVCSLEFFARHIDPQDMPQVFWRVWKLHHRAWHSVLTAANDHAGRVGLSEQLFEDGGVVREDPAVDTKLHVACDEDESAVLVPELLVFVPLDVLGRRKWGRNGGWRVLFAFPGPSDFVLVVCMRTFFRTQRSRHGAERLERE